MFTSCRSTIALLAAGALLFSACGGGDAEAASTTKPQASTESAATDVSNTGDADTEAALAKIGGDPFCKEMAKVALNLDSANPSGYFEALSALAKTAPAEIKDDITVLAESGAVLADPTKAKPEDAALIDSVTKAGTAMDDWTKANCTGVEELLGG